MSRDLSKQDLYESVKTLIETEDKHILLNQHKLFTLFSIGFQYLLYSSTKNPGAYIIRVEDSKLAEKLARKSKDPSTRKFIQSLLIPRKLKFQKSMFYLDFFNVQTWNMTADIPREKIKGALIIKDSSEKPMDVAFEATEGDEEEAALLASLPKDYFISSLMEFVPKTITIAFDFDLENSKEINFPFIKKDVQKTISGVTISSDVGWDSLE